MPGPGKYKGDHPVNYDTFGKLMAKSKETGRTKREYFGKEDRFKDIKKSKSLAHKPTPSSNQYDMR